MPTSHKSTVVVVIVTAITIRLLPMRSDIEVTPGLIFITWLSSSYVAKKSFVIFLAPSLDQALANSFCLVHRPAELN